MKGFVLSVAVFVVYVLLTALVSHLARPDRHARIFLPGIALAIGAYFACYFLLPSGLGFLPESWLATYTWLDLLLGAFILVLNIHNYIDWFFGFNGGFSTSLILLIHRAGANGLRASDLIAKYHGRDGMDKIYGWRLPRLEETGYIAIDKQTGLCTLTANGRRAAMITRMIKRMLNLGAGG
ncbi:MAG TPA: hypothetical protein VG733_03855 [Chthoniobacteraceae bacterium]|nr:hypothetical protein [Chthoniobacteraceae bacterium]